MGIDLVNTALARYSRLPGSQFKVLVAMCSTALDQENENGHQPRLYYAGWERLALAMGKDVPDDTREASRRRAKLRREVSDVCLELRKAGAVWRQIEHPQIKVRQVFYLMLDPARPDPSLQTKQVPENGVPLSESTSEEVPGIPVPLGAGVLPGIGVPLLPEIRVPPGTPKPGTSGTRNPGTQGHIEDPTQDSQQDTQPGSGAHAQDAREHPARREPSADRLTSRRPSPSHDRPVCTHWDGRRGRSTLTVDGDCLRCGMQELCEGCVRLQRNGDPHVRCYDHQVAS